MKFKFVRAVIVLSFAFSLLAILGCEPSDLEVLFAFPPTAGNGEAYEFLFEAHGGKPPYQGWRIAEGEVPAGLTLDPETGLLSGTVPAGERLYYFVVEVDDSAWNQATAAEAFGILVTDSAGPGTLLQRARAYQEVYLARHNSDGLTVTADNPDDPGGDYW